MPEWLREAPDNADLVFRKELCDDVPTNYGASVQTTPLAARLHPRLIDPAVWQRMTTRVASDRHDAKAK
jgi:hypothetical protein